VIRKEVSPVPVRSVDIVIDSAIKRAEIAPEEATGILDRLRLMQVEPNDNLPPFPCPRCGENGMRPITQQNARSRFANVYICSVCGTDEAMREAAGDPQLPLNEWSMIKSFI
jgi:predicted RNA-binding Zn-ribbon protein involved in translation (DUF1610 family)